MGSTELTDLYTAGIKKRQQANKIGKGPTSLVLTFKAAPFLGTTLQVDKVGQTEKGDP